ncbi:MAG: substrate-binding domain-containing protein [Lachnospiraceae bacterium]|nr:substrate-binding domain-containing protein [Lachnospiraceae bacterium]
MKKRNTNVLIIALILALALILEFVYYKYFLTREEQIRQISLIVYGSDAARWENLRQGAELAARDLNAEVTLITMSSESDAKEQITLIRREIVNGADGLLIAACDSDVIGSYLEKHPIGIPYAFVESGPKDEKSQAPLYAADDQKMAEALLKNIATNEKDWIKAAVVCDHTERDSVRKRLNAIMNSDISYAEEVVLWEKNEQEQHKKAQFFLQRKLTEEAVDVVIAVDNSSMEELLDATVNLNKDIKIYGIADSAKSVYYLDKGLIKLLVFQDEFSAGYKAVSDLMGKDRKQPVSTERSLIRYEMIDHANMYDMAYQKMLFPHLR